MRRRPATAELRFRLGLRLRIVHIDESVSVKPSMRSGLRPNAYLDKGGKPASAACNLQHLGAFPLGVSAPAPSLHEGVQGHQALPLHGVLPAQEQRLCGGLVHTGGLF